MKNFSLILAISALLISITSCKSGKSSCDAYGKVKTENVSDQASK